MGIPGYGTSAGAPTEGQPAGDDLYAGCVYTPLLSFGSNGCIASCVIAAAHFHCARGDNGVNCSVQIQRLQRPHPASSGGRCWNDDAAGHGHGHAGHRDRHGSAWWCAATPLPQQLPPPAPMWLSGRGWPKHADVPVRRASRRGSDGDGDGDGHAAGHRDARDAAAGHRCAPSRVRSAR